MNENNFLPLWYRKRIKEKRYFRLKVNLTVLLLLIVFAGINIIMNYQNISSLNKEIQQILQNNKLEKSRLQLIEKEKVESINTLRNFIVNIYDKKYLYMIKIRDNRVEIEGVYPNRQKVEQFIAYIEENKKFKILDLELDGEKSNVKLKLNLGVKNG
ncbi:hypothetical protein [Clostridium sp. ZS2-4]|uniref:hypothetical protein n=1 Tax=Clostridium sp. ZS2-4 TaxID=2987703 RepID=UPI00227C14E8|nr:hypothetical protein [Clostridium sp. ZS2-4]MCY6354063.1 hypothetical protein [Clostridium sp. ZS2-4]